MSVSRGLVLFNIISFFLAWSIFVVVVLVVVLRRKHYICIHENNKDANRVVR